MASATTTEKPLSIALITCSVRAHRINPLITAYVASHLSAAVPPTSQASFTTIDLATPGLLPPLVPTDPAQSESLIPAQHDKRNPTPEYADATTRTLSALIAAHDAFVFVTPQYNWGFPAAVKHAIDLLFYEWCGKAAWVVSYGAHGGGKGKAQFEQVLKGCRMQVVGEGPEKGVEIEVPVPVGIGCIKAGALGEDLVQGWKEHGVEERLNAGLKEMLGVLEGSS